MLAPPETPLPPSRARHTLRYLVAVVFTLLVAVFAVPDLLFGLDRRSPFAQIESFRPWVLVGALGLLVVLAVLMRFDRRVWPFAAGTLVVLVAGTSLVVPRIIADPAPAGGTPFTVLSLNTYEGTADLTELTNLIRAVRPDVIALPESGDRFRSRFAPLVAPLGYTVRSSTGPEVRDVHGVTMAVSDRLGDVSFRIGDETYAFPYVEATGGGLGALRFVAFHSVAPVPGSVPGWNSDLALLRQWCAGPTPAVVAGDFNATLDNSPLRTGTAGCSDAASQRGDGLIPTWGPSPRVRALAGPQIDHIFSTGGIVAETFSAYDITHSDHRAILSTLRLPS